RLHREGLARPRRRPRRDPPPRPRPAPRLPGPAPRPATPRRDLRLPRLPPEQAPRRPPPHALVGGRADGSRRARAAVPAPPRDGPRGRAAARAVALGFVR